MLLSLSITESDGANDTAPAKGTLYIRAQHIEDAAPVQVPKHLYAAVYELAQLAEDAGWANAEQIHLARIQQIESEKLQLQQERAERQADESAR